MGAAMIDRPQLAAPEPGRQLIGVHPIALVAAALVAVAVTDHYPVDQRDQEFMEPLRLGLFLKRDVDRPPHPAEEIGQRRGLGRDDGPAHSAMASRPLINSSGVVGALK
jgi:hypothetical protein